MTDFQQKRQAGWWLALIQVSVQGSFINQPTGMPHSCLEPTLAMLEKGDGPATVHLNRGYDSGITRNQLAALGLGGAEIAEKEKPPLVTAGQPDHGTPRP